MLEHCTYTNVLKSEHTVKHLYTQSFGCATKSTQCVMLVDSETYLKITQYNSYETEIECAVRARES